MQAVPERKPFRSAAARLQAECHEAGDQFGVDPVRFGQSAPDLPESFGLRRRELPRPSESPKKQLHTHRIGDLF